MSVTSLRRISLHAHQKRRCRVFVVCAFSHTFWRLRVTSHGRAGRKQVKMSFCVSADIRNLLRSFISHCFRFRRRRAEQKYRSRVRALCLFVFVCLFVCQVNIEEAREARARNAHAQRCDLAAPVRARARTHAVCCLV